MLEKLNLGKTCLIALAALTISAIALDAAAQTVNLIYGTNEIHKSVAITNAQRLPDGRVNVAVQTGPVSRVCNLPPPAFMVNAYISAHTVRAVALTNLQALKIYNPPDGIKSLGTPFNVLLSVIAGESLPFVISDQDSMGKVINAPSGAATTQTLFSNCLSMPSFRVWKAEFTRVLSLYYGVAP